MIAVSRNAGLRYLLRAGVFLLICPPVGGIAYVLVMRWRDLPFDRPLALLGEIVFGVFAAYMLGWKAACATGLVMALFCHWIRLYPAALAASMLVGGAAGAWLIGPPISIAEPPNPDWTLAGFGAVVSLVSIWTIYHDRFLRPVAGTRSLQAE